MKKVKLKIEDFFTPDTMSIHLKEGVVPYAKRGKPGNWEFVPIGDKPLTKEEMEEMAKEIVEIVRTTKEGFVEFDRKGSTIVQFRNYRIVIARPPFSDGWEITASRPIVKLSLKDYKLPKKLIERFEKRAEGILIAGAPGMGKSCFAQALAEFYLSKNKVVKTIESPRDLQLPASITQYSKSLASSEEIHDVLLLSRPDYTVFDEMRDDPDFKLFSDLRLAGVGMIGVVHATEPIDAVQRFVRRVELGMIPSILDTVVFMKDGRVEKVYELKMTVKMPTGMRERDLTRPVVEIRDFLSGKLEYELYTFGEETVVVPVEKILKKRRSRLVSKIKKELGQIGEKAEIEVEDDVVLIRISKKEIPYLIGKKGKRIKKIEKKIGKKVKVEAL